MMFFNKNLKTKNDLDELFNSTNHKFEVKSSRVDFSQPSLFLGRLKSTLLSNHKHEVKLLNPAFTLAEVLLVLVILGVIAAITMPTLNLSGNKEKAIKVKATKVVGELENAFDLIKTNDSRGSLLAIHDPYNPSTTFSIDNPDEKDKLKAVLAKYLKMTNKPCEKVKTCFCYGKLNSKPNHVTFYLNNGACVGIRMHYNDHNDFGFPKPNCNKDIQHDAVMYLDVNGQEGPNQIGIDQYHIPITAEDGVDYSCTPCDVTGCAQCAPGDPSRCLRCKTMCADNDAPGGFSHCSLEPKEDGKKCG